MTSAFYPGAGIDIVPPTLFRSIKQWFYMDSQPRSEFGNKIENVYARPRFIPKLITVMNKNGFDLHTMQDNVYTFYHSDHDQTIHYETNAVFPEALQSRHRDCDTLVLCGYELDHPPPDFIASYSHIITDSRSVYDEEDKQILFYKHVSTMLYDPTWKYWEPSQRTTPKIQRYVTIINRFLTYNELYPKK